MEGTREAGRKVRRSRQEWSELVRRASRSRLSLEEFGERNGVSGKQLSWWKWWLAGSEKRAAGAGGDARAAAPQPVTFIGARVQDATRLEPRAVPVARSTSTCHQAGAKATLEPVVGWAHLTFTLEWSR